MIRMTRLHLINWHNFQDDIIDFKNITYLLGVNAVGKTTIMDAVRYCLTTNKDFNTAGNKKSGRTLLGSVHQKQRAEDSYLRPGHTVSYIGIEFLDEAIKKNCNNCPYRIRDAEAGFKGGGSGLVHYKTGICS